MSRIRSTHQLEGLITLDNKKCIAVFSDFDSAVLFRAHHPAWEVHIHLIIPRSPQTPPTSATVYPQPPLEPVERGDMNKQILTLRHTSTRNLGSRSAYAQGALNNQKNTNISAYLTDGETIYKQAIFTAEQLGIANDHAQTETQGALYWETHYRVVEEAVLTNPNSLA